jgi:hypothetical protein
MREMAEEREQLRHTLQQCEAREEAIKVFSAKLQAVKNGLKDKMDTMMVQERARALVWYRSTAIYHSSFVRQQSVSCHAL